jgi:hypothetical protein
MAVVEARKRAPPEKPEARNLRTKIVLSFWAVVLLLGLPTWLKTTQIYRADLPLESMFALSDGQVDPHHINHRMKLMYNRFQFPSCHFTSGSICPIHYALTPGELLEKFRTS